MIVLSQGRQILRGKTQRVKVKVVVTEWLGWASAWSQESSEPVLKDELKFSRKKRRGFRADLAA